MHFNVIIPFSVNAFTVNEPRHEKTGFLARSQGELIVYPWSSVRGHPFTLFKHLLLRNCLANESKFYVEHPWVGGMQVYINGPGHMTKMAAMLKNAQNLKKSSSPEPLGHLP